MKCKQYVIEVDEKDINRFYKDFPRTHCRPIVLGEDIEKCYPTRALLTVLFEDELSTVVDYVRKFTFGKIFEMKEIR